MSELVLRCSLDTFNGRNGWSADCGGSLCKMAYTVETSDCVEVHLVYFTVTDQDAVLNYINKHCRHCFRKGEKMFITGHGTGFLSEPLKNIYGVSLELLPETSLYSDALKFLLENFSVDEVIDRISPETFARGKLHAEEFLLAGKFLGSEGMATREYVDEYMDKMEEKLLRVNGQSKFDPSEIFPCLVTVAGSATVFAKCEESKFSVLTISSRAGKLFQSQGFLMTGAKTYRDLVDLASQGVAENISVTGEYLVGSSGSYESIPRSAIVFSFGHINCNNTDINYNKADLAAALLDNTAQDITQICGLTARLAGVGTIFVSGGFISGSEVVRHYVGKYLTKLCMIQSSSTGKPIVFHFLKHGAFLSAIGCLQRSLTQKH